MMDLLNSLLDLVVPPASLAMLAFAWPSLTFLHACEWLVRSFYSEDMEDKVVVITGASSGIGEQIAYEYAKRGANLVLVARRENKLWAISENAREIGAKHVMVMAADVVKEEDCRRFIDETIYQYGRLDHLVNTTSLGHTFLFEEATDTSVFPQVMDINFWGNVYPTFFALPHLRLSQGRVVVNASIESWLPMPGMSLYAAAKAATINFYETLRFEVGNEVGITIATHGLIGGEMQWKDEREVSVSSGYVEEFSKLIVSGACRGEPHVRFPGWHDIFQIYRVFAPEILGWSFRLLLANHTRERSSSAGSRRQLLDNAPTRPLLETTSPRKLILGPVSFTPHHPHQPYKVE